MVIKRFLKLYAVICMGILCFPLLWVINTTSGAEAIGNELENRSVDQPSVAMNDVQHDWNSWSSIENASDVNPGSHNILLAGNTAESHAKASAESASHKAEATGADSALAFACDSAESASHKAEATGAVATAL